jgi:ATP-dependent 26S proteasome regulatory subunit
MEIFNEEMISSFNNIKFDKIEIDEIIKNTDGLYYGEMITLLDMLKTELNKVNTDYKKSINIINDVWNKFSRKRKFQQENKLNIDQVSWNDVGGLNDIKKIITDTILLPLKYPSLFTSNDKQLGISRSGILLYGSPGTGNSLFIRFFFTFLFINDHIKT